MLFSFLQVIELACHRLNITNDNSTNLATTTCQCKPDCDGSLLYNYKITADIQIKVRQLSALSFDQFSSYPKWIVSALEDQLLTPKIDSQVCLCGYQQAIPSKIQTALFLKFTLMFAQCTSTLFYPSIDKASNSLLLQVTPVNIVTYMYYLLYPVMIVFSIFGILVIVRLSTTEPTSTFIVQRFQIITSVLLSQIDDRSMLFLLLTGLTSDSDYTKIVLYFFYDSVTLLNHYLTICLMLDRLFSVWHPMLYRKHANRKNAVRLIIAICLFSILIPISRAIVGFIQGTELKPFLVVYFYVIGTISSTVVIAIIAFLLGFITILRKIVAADATSNMKKLQKNINYIVVCNSLIDGLIYFSVAVFKYTFSLEWSEGINVNSQLVYDIHYYFTYILRFMQGTAPAFCVILCSFVSPMSRKAVSSFIAFKLSKVNPTLTGIKGSNISIS